MKIKKKSTSYLFENKPVKSAFTGKPRKSWRTWRKGTFPAAVVFEMHVDIHVRTGEALLWSLSEATAGLLDNETSGMAGWTVLVDGDHVC